MQRIVVAVGLAAAVVVGATRQEAERTLEENAVAGGIIERARTNAEHTVETLVRSLGYTTVVVTSRLP